LKVLILHNDFRVYWKGRLAYLRDYLGEKDISFYAIELFGKGSPYLFDTYNNEENWWFCLFPNNSFQDLSKEEIVKALFVKLDEINPDIVIGGSIVFFAGALGIRWAKNNKRKFIMFDDAKPSQIKRNFVVQWVKDVITNEIDGLWLPSPDYDEEYSNMDKDETLFFHGYNCIDNQLFKFKEKRDTEYTTIICVARLVPIKNIDNLLKAWKLIEKRKPNYKLVIIGDGPEFVKLSELTLNMRLKTVVFLGAVNNSDIPAYFYNSAAFVLPSLSESWGLVVNEAMAAGLPILLSNKINASVALLKEGENGFSFDPLNVKDIAEKILAFMNLDLKSKKEMSLNSFKIISSMSYENMGSQLFEALIQINKEKVHRPNLIASVIINIWHGRYNTSGWDKL
jgi:glycosyltransferase involved in cell wall biosynthesis